MRMDLPKHYSCHAILPNVILVTNLYPSSIARRQFQTCILQHHALVLPSSRIHV
ncbi:hypothetical protein BDC45DRAFT_508671 [Circinella umbellata]|nr:hypothetical protein BDC45DRAFT_508671 [Circinella umbellata]